MLNEVLRALAPRPGEQHLDGTFGGGGYARAILGAADCTLWAIDRDPDAIRRGEALARDFRTADGHDRLRLLHGDFGSMMRLLDDHGVSALDGVVLDLGVSSFQIDQAERGFSFRFDGPLDMRMDHEGETAADLVNNLPEAELADLLFHLGEERLSRRIARRIVAARAEAPILSTGRLASLIREVVPADRSGIDPATRSFQALRIRVNDELRQIETGLEQAAALLRPGGRLVVVSFHSLEDRIVKRFMADAAGRRPAASRHDPRNLEQRPRPSFELVTTKAQRPGDAESRANPRARSARLRAMRRLDIDLPQMAGSLGSAARSRSVPFPPPGAAR
ncbi:16S rRNA (cytosine(1402)-N(4))-methyltransferase RsmH [Acetobacteraceae bacterium KSS12]|uniref:Ribosomal RNA small subunit methyltransferase H n=2 Tax=Rhizosaccharibacter radicis TaxID=2782605 RepID=A0ABT1VY42_9PROT|nr:16S rRNA (cytosine(1402)-N(4))-methyltransferase RsmH [Acetobacteraceae bacterium KSS12]